MEARAESLQSELDQLRRQLDELDEGGQDET